jgi:DNA polymerase-3 subunit epsilon
MMAGHFNPKDKEKAQEWARTLLRQPNFYILDTETTGIGPRDEIVQLGVVDKSGKIILNTLVKPSQPVPLAAMAVHKITNERLADALPFSEWYVKLSALLAGQTLIAYNMDFDWRMLTQSASIYGLPPFPVKAAARHCAMKEYAKFKGQMDLRARTYRWYKLAEACKQQRIKVENAHDALGDVQMTLLLIRKMAEMA